MVKEVYIGADHAGFVVKEIIRKILLEHKIDYIDLSPEKIEGDDYPDVAFRVAEKVAKEDARGILACGTGEGMVIAANKVKGIRAVEVSDVATAKLTREHNDANILALGVPQMKSHLIRPIVITWISTKFTKEKRHKRRLKKIARYEDGR